MLDIRLLIDLSQVEHKLESRAIFSFLHCFIFKPPEQHLCCRGCLINVDWPNEKRVQTSMGNPAFPEDTFAFGLTPPCWPSPGKASMGHSPSVFMPQPFFLISCGRMKECVLKVHFVFKAFPFMSLKPPSTPLS